MTVANSALWSKARAVRRNLGLADGLFYGFDRVAARLTRDWLRLRCYYLVAQPVPEASWLPSGRGRRIDVRRVLPQEIAAIDLPRPRAVIEDRYRQGSVCFMAFCEGRMIGFIWLLLATYREDEVRCWFQPEPAGTAAWDFDVYVDPAWRIGPTFGRLWDEANRYLREQGRHWTMSRISVFNAASVASHRRLRARFLGRANFLVLGRLQIMGANVAPYIHVSLDPGGGPTLVARAPGPD